MGLPYGTKAFRTHIESGDSCIDGPEGSSCAAEVVAIGSEIHDFAIGDHVAPTFDLNNLEGTEDEMAVPRSSRYTEIIFFSD
jgi:hypothetical protein